LIYTHWWHLFIVVTFVIHLPTFILHSYGGSITTLSFLHCYRYILPCCVDATIYISFTFIYFILRYDTSHSIVHLLIRRCYSRCYSFHSFIHSSHSLLLIPFISHSFPICSFTFPFPFIFTFCWFHSSLMEIWSVLILPMHLSHLRAFVFIHIFIVVIQSLLILLFDIIHCYLLHCLHSLLFIYITIHSCCCYSTFVVVVDTTLHWWHSIQYSLTSFDAFFVYIHLLSFIWRWYSTFIHSMLLLLIFIVVTSFDLPLFCPIYHNLIIHSIRYIVFDWWLPFIHILLPFHWYLIHSFLPIRWLVHLLSTIPFIPCLIHSGRPHFDIHSSHSPFVVILLTLDIICLIVVDTFISDIHCWPLITIYLFTTSLPRCHSSYTFTLLRWSPFILIHSTLLHSFSFVIHSDILMLIDVDDYSFIHSFIHSFPHCCYLIHSLIHSSAFIYFIHWYIYIRYYLFDDVTFYSSFDLIFPLLHYTFLSSFRCLSIIHSFIPLIHSFDLRYIHSFIGIVIHSHSAAAAAAILTIIVYRWWYRYVDVVVDGNLMIFIHCIHSLFITFHCPHSVVSLLFLHSFIHSFIPFYDHSFPPVVIHCYIVDLIDPSFISFIYSFIVILLTFIDPHSIIHSFILMIHSFVTFSMITVFDHCHCSIDRYIRSSFDHFICTLVIHSPTFHSIHSGMPTLFIRYFSHFCLFLVTFLLLRSLLFDVVVRWHSWWKFTQYIILHIWRYVCTFIPLFMVIPTIVLHSFIGILLFILLLFILDTFIHSIHLYIRWFHLLLLMIFTIHSLFDVLIYIHLPMEISHSFTRLFTHSTFTLFLLSLFLHCYTFIHSYLHSIDEGTFVIHLFICWSFIHTGNLLLILIHLHLEADPSLLQSLFIVIPLHSMPFVGNFIYLYIHFSAFHLLFTILDHSGTFLIHSCSFLLLIPHYIYLILHLQVFIYVRYLTTTSCCLLWYIVLHHLLFIHSRSFIRYLHILLHSFILRLPYIRSHLLFVISFTFCSSDEFPSFCCSFICWCSHSFYTLLRPNSFHSPSFSFCCHFVTDAFCSLHSLHSFVHSFICSVVDLSFIHLIHLSISFIRLHSYIVGNLIHSLFIRCHSMIHSLFLFIHLLPVWFIRLLTWLTHCQ